MRAPGNHRAIESPIAIAIIAGVVVFALGIVLMLTRSTDRKSEQDLAPADLPEPVASPPTPASNRAAPEATAPAPAPQPARVVPEQPAADEVPIWARPPNVLTMPFPEGGRYNPPLPPVKLLPGMVDPAPPSPDAGAAAPDPQRIDSNSMSNTNGPLGASGSVDAS